MLGPDARFRPPGGGRERLLTPTNLDSLLGEPMRETGEWCALASRYRPGDRIFLFGFSRGAAGAFRSQISVRLYISFPL